MNIPVRCRPLGGGNSGGMMAGGAGKVEDEALARQARSLQQSKGGPPAQAARAKGRRAPAAAGESPTRVPETGARGLLPLMKNSCWRPQVGRSERSGPAK